MDSLVVKNLNKHYTNFDLVNVSFCVPRGAIVGLIGENGAGKSTVIKSIVGAVHPDEGSIFLWGKEQSRLTAAEKQKIAVVLDDTGLPMEVDLKILDRIMANIFDRWDRRKFRDLVLKMELPLDKPIKEFSKGMKAKAAIAVALAHDSEFLVLDEPTSGLDPVVREEILDLLYDYIQDGARSILISSHITSDLEKLCDSIVYIHRGRVLLDAEKDSILESYVIFSCEEKILKELPASNVERFIKREFGVDVLAKKKEIPKGFVYRRVSLEDIMLFYSKGERL